MTTKQVLVIDDETAVRKIICDNLKLCGLDVASAGDGAAGLALIDPARQPGLVITDIIMPGISGLDVITAIRQQFPAIRLIAISGGGKVKATDDLLERAAALGADAVLAKPLDLDLLEETVFKLLG